MPEEKCAQSFSKVHVRNLKVHVRNRSQKYMCTIFIRYMQKTENFGQWPAKKNLWINLMRKIL